MKERGKEKGAAKKVERGRRLVFMAAAAKKSGVGGGEINEEPFVVLTSESAEGLLKLTGPLGLFIDFVVSYKENDRIKYSVLEHARGDEIVLFEPDNKHENHMTSDQFKKKWEKADNWIMMVRKEGSRI